MTESLYVSLVSVTESLFKVHADYSYCVGLVCLSLKVCSKSMLTIVIVREWCVCHWKSVQSPCWLYWLCLSGVSVTESLFKVHADYSYCVGVVSLSLKVCSKSMLTRLTVFEWCLCHWKSVQSPCWLDWLCLSGVSVTESLFKVHADYSYCVGVVCLSVKVCSKFMLTIVTVWEWCVCHGKSV